MTQTIKKIFAAGFIYFSVVTISAQTNLQAHKELIIGKNYKTDQVIKAREYNFLKSVKDFVIDTTANLLTIELRKKTTGGLYFDNSSTIVLYDLSKKKIKWNKKVHYNSGGILYYKRGIVQAADSRTCFLDLGNGENKWNVENTMCYVDPLQGVGIGYKFKPFPDYCFSLEGIDMTYGRQIWERRINRNFDWREVHHLNSSEIVVASNELNLINLKNGKGWGYNTFTEETRYTGTDAGKTSGASKAALAEETSVTSTGLNLRTGVVSNILLDDSAFFFASKQKISRIDHQGHIQWSMPLTNNMASNPSLYIKDSILSIINKGSIYADDKQLFYGSPFFASFNKYTGKEIYFNSLNPEKDQIGGYTFNQDTIFLVFKDRVAKYAMKNGSLILNQTYNVNELGELKCFVDAHFYLQSGPVYSPLSALGSKQYLVLTKKEKVLVLNEKLDIIKQVNYDQLYVHYIKTNGYTFLARGDKTVVINKENKMVAEIEVTGNAFIIGSTLYDLQDKRLLEIEIPELTMK